MYKLINLLAQASTLVIQHRDNTENPGFLCNGEVREQKAHGAEAAVQRGQGGRRVYSDVNGSVTRATKASKMPWRLH